MRILRTRWVLHGPPPDSLVFPAFRLSFAGHDSSAAVTGTDEAALSFREEGAHGTGYTHILPALLRARRRYIVTLVNEHGCPTAGNGSHDNDAGTIILQPSPFDFRPIRQTAVLQSLFFESTAPFPRRHRDEHVTA